MIEPLSPNAKVDHFVITEVLGHGGFGITYKAKDTRLDSDVVLKEPIPDCACVRDEATGHLKPADEKDQQTFDAACFQLLREAKVMADLQHPCIVPIRDFLTAEGAVFLVMPYLSGGTLADTIDDDRSPEEVISLLRALLQALSYIHKQGLLHRDIKPSNIVFGAAGNPLLIDMGSTHHFDGKTIQGASYTPDYAAPEIIVAYSGVGKLTPAADLYSLAATMREVICGIAPETSQNRIKQDCMKPLSSDESRVDKWGKDFLDAIDKNLALDPEQRMQSADEWLRVLDGTASVRDLPLDIELLPRMGCSVTRGRRKPFFCYPGIRIVNHSSYAFRGLHVTVTNQTDGTEYFNNIVNVDAEKELLIEKKSVDDLRPCPESFVIQLKHETGTRTFRYKPGWDANVNPTVPPFEVYWRRCTWSYSGRNPIIVNTSVSTIEVSLWRSQRAAKGNPYVIRAGKDFQFGFSEWKHSLDENEPFWIKIGDVTVNCIIRPRHWRG